MSNRIGSVRFTNPAAVEARQENNIVKLYYAVNGKIVIDVKDFAESQKIIENWDSIIEVIDEKIQEIKNENK